MPTENDEPLVSRCADDPEMVDLVARFSRVLPARMDEIADALHERRLEDARRLSHQLKGSAGGYGFPEISVAAERLEAILRAGRDGADDALAALTALCRRVKS
jgi:HPt (histidine-containing phosphotransfer) domain-containing protein